MCCYNSSSQNYLFQFLVKPTSLFSLTIISISGSKYAFTGANIIYYLTTEQHQNEIV